MKHFLRNNDEKSLVAGIAATGGLRLTYWIQNIPWELSLLEGFFFFVIAALIFRLAVFK